MIRNERQYRMTKAQLRNLEKVLKDTEGRTTMLPKRLEEAMVQGLRSQIDELKKELHEYEALKQKKVKTLVLNDIDDLPVLLIKARISKGYSQKDLAKKLHLHPQQIQKYEAENYRSINFDRLRTIAHLLGIELHEKVKIG